MSSGAGPAQSVGSQDTVLDQPSGVLGLYLSSETSQCVILNIFLFSLSLNVFICKTEIICVLPHGPVLTEVLQSSEKKMVNRVIRCLVLINC